MPATPRTISTSRAPVRVRRRAGIAPARNLVDQVVTHLRARILAGDHAVGVSLPSEGDLAESFGVSRTVIREAMRSLRAQGLVVMSQGSRPRVAEVDARPTVESLALLLARSRTTLLGLTEVRRPLETEIARLAATRATAEQIAALCDANVELEHATTLEQRVAADVRFHDRLAVATGNPVFGVLLGTLGGLLVESRRRTIRAAGVAPALIGHREILAAVDRHDPTAAEAAMRRHLDWAERDIRADARARIRTTSSAGADGS
ncbi:MAG: FadR/GntR family transcriptional regulator [Planctomycetaceae bacterium]